MNQVSLDSLISSGCIHLSAAAFFGYWLISWLDLRRMAAVSKVLLTGLATAASLRSAIYLEDSSHRIAWMACAVLGVVALVQSIQQWISASPGQLHNEANQQNASKTRLKKEGERKAKVTSGAFGKIQFAGWLGTLASFGSMFFVKQAEVWTLETPYRYFASVEIVGTTMMLGLSLFLCVEMTFLTTPDALNATSPSARINWTTVSRLTMVVSILLLACCLLQFLQKPSTTNVDSDIRMVQVAARIFGLTLLVAVFIVWMVPRRLSSYQKRNSIPNDWVSLTMTTWLGMLAFLVVATLPANWPWRELIR